MEVELILALKSSQLNIFNMLKPVMAAGGDVPFILITLLQCFVAGSCCDSEEHLTNRREPGYVSTRLEDVRCNFRSVITSDVLV